MKVRLSACVDGASGAVVFLHKDIEIPFTPMHGLNIEFEDYLVTIEKDITPDGEPIYGTAFNWYLEEQVLEVNVSISAERPWKKGEKSRSLGDSNLEGPDLEKFLISKDWIGSSAFGMTENVKAATKQYAERAKKKKKKGAECRIV